MADIIGSIASDQLTGGPGADLLSGLGGNDRLAGLGGADQLDGGSGFDLANYRDSPTGVRVNLVTGQGFLGDAEGDQLSFIEGLIGSMFDDELTGDNQNNRLNGNDGKDILDGAGGNDRIQGGEGADTMVGGGGTDTLSYLSSDAGVSVNLGSGLTGGGHAAGDLISGFENLVGSGHADTLTGSDDRNKLFGRSGNDMLDGGAGNDVLIGGLGGDVMDGGAGIDTANYRLSTQNLSINTRNNQMLGAAAGDTLTSIEVIIATEFGDGLIVGDADDKLFGMGGDDFIDAGDGNDRLIGGAGADFLHGGNGIDTADYRSSGAAIQVSLTLGPNTGGDAEGDTFSWIENIDGSAFGDTIEGDILANKLRGLDGNDTLTGRAGKDVLVGGGGVDQFAFVDLADHAGQTQDNTDAIGGYVGSTEDRIVDFEIGTDLLAFSAAAFAGSVHNTNTVADLGLAAPGDSAFAFTGAGLFYVQYSSAAQVSVLHLAQLSGVAALSDTDIAFI